MSMSIENEKNNIEEITEGSSIESDDVYQLEDPISKIKVRYNISELNDPVILNAIVVACRRRFDENPTWRGTSRQERVIAAALTRLSQLGSPVTEPVDDIYLKRKKERNNV